MDYLPLIQENLDIHEVSPTLRKAFQETLNGQIYPKKTAEQFVYSIKDEDSTIKHTANRVLEVHKEAQKAEAKSKLASIDLMYQQAMYMIQKDKIDRSAELRENIKLKRCTLFKHLEEGFVKEFNLIRKSDLLPDMIHRYLDFRNFEHTVCPACKEKIATKEIKQKLNLDIKNNFQSDTVTLLKKSTSYEVEPSSLIFHNYQVGEVYKKNIKIINISGKTQSIAIRSLPTTPYFSAIIIDNQRLAPGMSVMLTITFKPKIYVIVDDKLELKNKEGETVEVLLKCTRDVPKLVSCIFKSTSNLLESCAPEKVDFVQKRREALNYTIDCGSCLVSQYILISMVFENRGNDGAFFIITEEDWYFQNVETISTNMELFKGPFWIYPTYFEVCKDDLVEVNIIFQPYKPGLQVETLFLICNNNSFQQIELVGDALEFSPSFIEIDVPPKDTHINEMKNYCVYFENLKNDEPQYLTVIVRNKSQIALTCEWRFRHTPKEGINDMPDNWITSNCTLTHLHPWGYLTYEFKINANTNINGYHNIFFCLYVTNLPAISLMENEELTIVECDDVAGKTLSQAVDVLITEFEVCAMVNIDPPKVYCDCACDAPVDLSTNMGFSCPVLNFGIVPSGLNVQKHFYIRNDRNFDQNWSILEVKYNLDSKPHMEVIKCSPHLTESSGFCRRRRNKRLFYKIVNEKPISWVSILVLVAVNLKGDSTIEDICIVTYEVINFDIVVKGDQSKYVIPALMPMHVMYRGIPTELKFGVENRSLITGYFQFFPAFGEDRDKLMVKLSPTSSVIKPFETITITATLLCCEIGFIQNFFLPCFVGIGQEPLVLRVLCTVDGPHVFFYLPVEKKIYKKVTWPPKILYEYDTDPLCVCTNKECLKYEDQDEYLDDYEVPFENLMNGATNRTYIVNDLDLKPSASGDTEKLMKSEESSRSTDFTSRTRRLEGLISEEFDTDNILHDDIVEVHSVPILTPTKVTIYIQNFTPIATKYNLEPQKFVENKKFDHVAVRLRLKKREDLWNDLMGTDYGILVQPEVCSGELNAYGSAHVDIWVYANTYGIYSEEIVVEMVEIPSYHFSMLIEVIGSPAVVPMGVNSITNYPTIRFGTIPFKSEPIKRQIKISNTSSIPIHIYWHALLRQPNDPGYAINEGFNIFLDEAGHEKPEQLFNLVYSLENYCGRNVSDFCYVEPSETDIAEHSNVLVQVVLRPAYLSNSSDLIEAACCLIGHIFLKPEHKMKPNYFVRKTGPDVNRIRIEATARIEEPKFNIELGDSNSLKIRMYANEVLLKKLEGINEYGVIRNLGESPCCLELSVNVPFYFKTKKGNLITELCTEVAPLSTVDLNICCNISFEQMLALSKIIYENFTDSLTFYDDYGDIADVDKSEKTIVMHKVMKIKNNDQIEQFPLEVHLYFPNISVSPEIVNFGHILLRSTRKQMITIYNYTGYTVKFEIYKSSGATCFVIVPHYGEIPPTLGMNSAFINVFIYFSPNECKLYKESCRVITNIPSYWKEIDLQGIGSMNMKYVKDYKI
ncbi:unnamed protein product [Phyllotreta striolata]|uniref:Uncharacterized protein n=1 Tax=Phyllotreta striolata TaxID=444603 RepID=A0A9N9TUF7_PHYSR|nr:unnamed protein product [Phyllotreta striolata]